MSRRYITVILKAVDLAPQQWLCSPCNVNIKQQLMVHLAR